MEISLPQRWVIARVMHGGAFFLPNKSSSQVIIGAPVTGGPLMC
ncbi:hypothetical protein LINGRAHAP2_LOCUS36484 [Linum grandiflorum]